MDSLQPGLLLCLDSMEVPDRDQAAEEQEAGKKGPRQQVQVD
jgi:hypothetical protein